MALQKLHIDRKSLFRITFPWLRDNIAWTSAFNCGYLRLPRSSVKDPILDQKLSTHFYNVECLNANCNPQSLRAYGQQLCRVVLQSDVPLSICSKGFLNHSSGNGSVWNLIHWVRIWSHISLEVMSDWMWKTSLSSLVVNTDIMHRNQLLMAFVTPESFLSQGWRYWACFTTGTWKDMRSRRWVVADK